MAVRIRVGLRTGIRPGIAVGITSDPLTRPSSSGGSAPILVSITVSPSPGVLAS